MPPVEKPVLDGNGAAVGPDPARIMAQQLGEVGQQRGTAADPRRNGRISLVRITGIKRDKVLGAISTPCGQPFLCEGSCLF